jgi:hypothetical protein
MFMLAQRLRLCEYFIALGTRASHFLVISIRVQPLRAVSGAGLVRATLALLYSRAAPFNGVQSGGFIRLKREDFIQLS